VSAKGAGPLWAAGALERYPPRGGRGAAPGRETVVGRGAPPPGPHPSGPPVPGDAPGHSVRPYDLRLERLPVARSSSSLR
jgi:hypothetical protein